MKDVSVSVIVPVYNKGEKLAACLESLLAQTLRTIEIVCVDDCSTDDSVQILDSFACADDRVKVLRHEKNKGVGAARNTGMSAAVGNYLTFVDADDTLDATTMEKMYQRCINTKADVGLYGIAYEYPSRQLLIPKTDSLDLSFLDGDAADPFSVLLAQENAFLFTFPSVCTKLFKRSFVESIDLRFTDHAIAEDLLFSCTALAKTDRVTALEEYLYIYDQETGVGATFSFRNIPAFLDVIKEFERRLSEAEILQDYSDALVNLALSHLENMMYDAQTTEEIREVFASLAQDKSGVFDADPNTVKFANDRFAAYYDIIRSKDPLAFATYRFRALQDSVVQERGRAEAAERELTSTRQQLRTRQEEIAALRSSRSYRVGNLLMRVPAKIKHAVGRTSRS